MKRSLIFIVMLTLCIGVGAKEKKQKQELWPNGEPVDAWFSDTAKVDVEKLGRKFIVTDYGVRQGSTDIQTKALQAVIDKAAQDGGGVVVIPRGTFFSGSLYFKPGTHLLLEEGAVLKGSDRIHDFDIKETRIEGETCKYFTALVNADQCDGFTIAGRGTIDGNGLFYWEQFWTRRQWNRQCTNKDEQRPRLVYISNSKNVTVQDVALQNSPFWTNHLYRCDHVRYLDCYIYSSTVDVKGPSTDAIDLDVCHDVLINGCYMNVNDDAVVLKGGKGTFADKAPENGPCYNIIIQNCHYGSVHGCLTLGSESIHDWNVILRNCHADNASRVIWLKMRPDTPQHYEYARVENFTGNCGNCLVVKGWSQFFNKQERDDMPRTKGNNVTLKNIRMTCKKFADVDASDKYDLADFTFEDIDCQETAAKEPSFKVRPYKGLTLKNVKINGTEIK